MVVRKLKISQTMNDKLRREFQRQHHKSQSTLCLPKKQQIEHTEGFRYMPMSSQTNFKQNFLNYFHSRQYSVRGYSQNFGKPKPSPRSLIIPQKNSLKPIMNRLHLRFLKIGFRKLFTNSVTKPVHQYCKFLEC